MNPELIFVIPFVAGLAWIIKEAILYNQKMIAMIGRREFMLINRDELLYVVPIPKEK